MNLQEIIQGLINSESDEGCDKGLTVVEKKWVNRLKNYLAEYKEGEKQRDLEKKREKAAEKAYKEDAFDGLEIRDSNEWITDNGEKYLKTFYYAANKDQPITRMAIFVVTFEENTAKIINAHISF